MLFKSRNEVAHPKEHHYLSLLILKKPGFCALKASGADWGEQDFNNILLGT